MIIKNDEIRNYPITILFETGLSNIANHQAQYGIFHEQDLNELIHQHKVLKRKLKILRNDLGQNIKRQVEPINNPSSWDFVLEEVTNIANCVKIKKMDKLIKHRKISAAIDNEWENRLKKKYIDKYQGEKKRISDSIRDRFNAASKKNTRIVTPRKGNLEIAYGIQKFWNRKFEKFDQEKNKLILHQLNNIKPSINLQS